MAAIRVKDFRGLAPIHPHTELPLGHAESALNCRFEAGNVMPLWSSEIQMPAFNGPIGTLYKYRFEKRGNAQWLGWPLLSGGIQWDVDVVGSPIPKDQLRRIYWTRVAVIGSSSDELPRAASQPTQGSIESTGVASGPVRLLGVPAPTEAPTVVEERGSLTAVPAAISQTAPIRVSFTGEHEFTDNMRVLVKLYTDETPPAGTGMSELNGKEFPVKVISATEIELRGSNGVNYSAFDPQQAPEAIVERIISDADLESRSYVYTYVSDWGEEGPPSPPTEVIEVLGSSPVTVTMNTSQIGQYRRPQLVRVYRSVSSATNVNFFFVKEFPTGGLDETIGVDDVDSAGIGEILPSEEWVPPPSGLTGLRQMPNGFLVGFIRNTLYFSEPFMPHAWPDRYRQPIKSDIVGIEVYGNTLVVATKGKPFLAYGADPASVSLEELDVYAPCLAKRGVVSIGAGVMYPTTHGMALANSQGVKVVTEGIASRNNWQQLWSPGSTIDAVFWNRCYIAIGLDADSFILTMDGTTINLSKASFGGIAPHVDPDDDSLHYMDKAALNIRRRLNPSAFLALPLNWASGTFVMPRPTNMAVAQVFADSYPLTLEVRHGLVLSSPASSSNNWEAAYAIPVLDAEPFRLPGGFSTREWAIRIEASSRVREVVLAESVEDLAQV